MDRPTFLAPYYPLNPQLSSLYPKYQPTTSRDQHIRPSLPNYVVTCHLATWPKTLHPLLSPRDQFGTTIHQPHYPNISLPNVEQPDRKTLYPLLSSLFPREQPWNSIDQHIRPLTTQIFRYLSFLNLTHCYPPYTQGTNSGPANLIAPFDTLPLTFIYFEHAQNFYESELPFDIANESWREFYGHFTPVPGDKRPVDCMSSLLLSSLKRSIAISCIWEWVMVNSHHRLIVTYESMFEWMIVNYHHRLIVTSWKYVRVNDSQSGTVIESWCLWFSSH